jgi:hypothetical protein
LDAKFLTLHVLWSVFRETKVMTNILPEMKIILSSKQPNAKCFFLNTFYIKLIKFNTFRFSQGHPQVEQDQIIMYKFLSKIIYQQL